MEFIPTCFEDLEWFENTKPTRAHFLAIMMALRERINFGVTSTFPMLEMNKYNSSVLEYNTISYMQMQDWIEGIYDMLRDLTELSKKNIETYTNELYEDYVVGFDDLRWAFTDTNIPYLDNGFWADAQLHDDIIYYLSYVFDREVCDVGNGFPSHRYSIIDNECIMRQLIRLKEHIGQLTEVYFTIIPLGTQRKQYYIDENRIVNGKNIPTFESVQRETGSVSGDWTYTPINGYWTYSLNDIGDDEYRYREEFHLTSNDCDLPFPFPAPARVSVSVWEIRQDDTSANPDWYWDFGTGLKLGWNDLGIRNQGERIPLLPKQGWGDEKATSIPPKRGTEGSFWCDWGIDYVKFDFYDSFKFKIPKATRPDLTNGENND